MSPQVAENNCDQILWDQIQTEMTVRHCVGGLSGDEGCRCICGSLQGQEHQEGGTGELPGSESENNGCPHREDDKWAELFFSGEQNERNQLNIKEKTPKNKVSNTNTPKN